MCPATMNRCTGPQCPPKARRREPDLWDAIKMAIAPPPQLEGTWVGPAGPCLLQRLPWGFVQWMTHIGQYLLHNWTHAALESKKNGKQGTS